MKAAEVQIGGEYEMRVGKETVHVRILAEAASGGWTALNLATNKKVFVSLARLLRVPETTPTTTAEGNQTMVEVPPVAVATNNETNTMPTRKKKVSDEAPVPAKKTSQIEAAFQVLVKAKEPMNCQAMVEAMATQGLWTSPGGKTPQATLYAAILREIITKGNDARFRKVDRGQFTAAGSEA
ncbi:MAG: winged helix-turn-helix domain-containing protein [Planctomycetaceae bacterium]|nr:winged helix-turn-helix domain-containing protein [Planctomycetaceae bacterium]